MGCAACKSHPQVSDDCALLPVRAPSLREREGTSLGAPCSLPRRISAAPADPTAPAGSPVLRGVGASTVGPKPGTHTDAIVHMMPDSGSQRFALRHLLRQGFPSSTPNPKLTRVPSYEASMVKAEAAATIVPRSVSSMPVLERSASSSGSAFSLNSADSLTLDLPPPPLPPLERLASLRSGATAAALMATHKTVAPRPDATSGAPLMTASRLRGTASSPAALPDIPTRVTSYLAPQNHSISSGSIASSSHDKTPESDRAQAAAGATLAPSSMTRAEAAARIVSSALLDVSFDSRIFAANDAATSAEIQRLGIRLQELQHEHNAPGVAPQVSAPLSSATGGRATTSKMLDCASAASKGTSEVRPGVPMASPVPAPESVGSLPSEPGLEHQHLYDETMKFVKLIREINEVRAAEHVGHRWFRWKALPPNKNGSAACDELGAVTVALSRTVPSTGSGRALSSGNWNEGMPFGSTVNDLRCRHLLRRRDRMSTRVRWVPYEMRESDFRTVSSTTPVCFCDHHATDTLTDGAGTIHLRERSRGIDIDFATSESQRLLQLGISSVATPSAVDTPPLPSGAPFTGRPSHLGTDVDKESTNCLEDSNGPLSSSAGTITSTNAPSISSDSLSSCPVHIAYRPVSILSPGKGKRSASTIGPPSSRRNLLEPPRVDVPATVTNRPAPAKPVEAHRPPSDPPCPTGDSGRRRIINADVPHRKQLAKRALEDNKLFFEMFLRKKSVS